VEIQSRYLQKTAHVLLQTELENPELRLSYSMPNGRLIAEGGYINHWGEQRIRLIGARNDD
jgi:hypothetical protein